MVRDKTAKAKAVEDNTSVGVSTEAPLHCRLAMPALQRELGAADLPPTLLMLCTARSLDSRASRRTLDYNHTAKLHTASSARHVPANCEHDAGTRAYSATPPSHVFLPPSLAVSTRDANAEDDPEAQCGNATSHAPCSARPCRRAAHPVGCVPAFSVPRAWDAKPQLGDVELTSDASCAGDDEDQDVPLVRDRSQMSAVAAFEAGRRYGRRETRRRCTTWGRRSSACRFCPHRFCRRRGACMPEHRRVSFLLPSYYFPQDFPMHESPAQQTALNCEHVLAAAARAPCRPPPPPPQLLCRCRAESSSALSQRALPPPPREPRAAREVPSAIPRVGFRARLRVATWRTFGAPVPAPPRAPQVHRQRRRATDVGAFSAAAPLRASTRRRRRIRLRRVTSAGPSPTSRRSAHVHRASRSPRRARTRTMSVADAARSPARSLRARGRCPSLRAGLRRARGCLKCRRVGRRLKS
ncbi:hypothetical protein B0H15DRAFT_1024013 [Mycena belliarum]|uniref:Uncharacterized protein n=1 Tax=Mycena belliarum TaxID=1033014 RepID=A0AAD6U330_9AGAR|nr:hypothetical protein B0H15DRAFT_1024013 [Mycena belliae]